MLVVEAHGARIPAIGLGTMTLKESLAVEIVEQALRVGYRHLDTAQMYGNEREVGEGLRHSGVPRNQVFVTTKVAWQRFHADDLRRSVDESLERLELPTVDLLLLHWPNPNVPLAETIGALCKVKTDGLARNIGVSNFTVALIGDALTVATEPLVCDQVECHPFLDQSKVLTACRNHGMALVAYSPLARGQFRRNEVLNRIGAAHQKTAAQICLRYLVQQDIVVIPRSSKLERLTENASLFDFTLSEAEMAEIAGLASPEGRTVDWAYSGRMKWD